MRQPATPCGGGRASGQAAANGGAAAPWGRAQDVQGRRSAVAMAAHCTEWQSGGRGVVVEGESRRRRRWSWSVARRLSIRRPGCPDELIFARSAWSRALTESLRRATSPRQRTANAAKARRGEWRAEGGVGEVRTVSTAQGAGKGAAGDGRSGHSDARHQCCGRHVQDALVVMIASRGSRG